MGEKTMIAVAPEIQVGGSLFKLIQEKYGNKRGNKSSLLSSLNIRCLLDLLKI